MPLLETTASGAARAFGLTSAGNNGLSVASAFTTAAEIKTAPVSGLYYIKTTGMSQARQMYIDTENTNGPANTKWVRIFLPSGFQYTWRDSNEDVDKWLNTDVPALLDSMSYFMYTFINTSTNARSQSWYFAKPSTNQTAFRNTPPTVHGGQGDPLITQVNTVRMSTGENYTSYLRSGVSSFGSMCDDSRSSYWGYTCLKAGNTPNTGSGGYSDFPSYATYSVDQPASSTYPTHCARSDEQYSNSTCSSSKQFAIYAG